MILEGSDHTQITAPTPARGGLTRRDFFAAVVDRLRAKLPPDLAAFHHKTTMNLLKIYFSNERVHYEVWLNSHQGATEIGLHFEDGPVSTAAYLTFFDRCIVELKDQLGAQIELERWTQSWGHLYEITPLTPLSDRVAERTARRLADLIRLLQPLVAEADVPPERSTQPSARFDPAKRWRRASR